MTDQHPLTDEICLDLMSDHWGNGGLLMDMRAAADWQLEQVIEYLRDIHEEHIGLLAVIKDLQEAMRPTTQEDN
jgi:hypothetical protein